LLSLRSVSVQLFMVITSDWEEVVVSLYVYCYQFRMSNRIRPDRLCTGSDVGFNKQES
jgi:hypothetical protein